jgi:hypothetical protein
MEDSFSFIDIREGLIAQIDILRIGAEDGQSK